MRVARHVLYNLAKVKANEVERGRERERERERV